MKNISIVLNVVLLIAVGVLYFLYFSGDKANTAEPLSQKGHGETDGTRIVYVNTDTLLNKYLLSIELNEAFLKKQEERRTELNIKAKEFDREATEFRRKLENNGFVSRERAEAAQQEILEKNQKLNMLQQEMTEKTIKEQGELNKRLFDTITSFLSEYNKEKGYSIILSTVLGGNVLYSEDGYDITNDIVKRLNERYTKKNKAE